MHRLRHQARGGDERRGRTIDNVRPFICFMRSREDTYDSKRLTKRVQPLRVQRRPSRFLSTDPDVRFCHLVQIRADSFWRARHVGHARWDSDLDRGVEILLSHTKHNSEIFFSALSFRMPYDGLSQWNSSNKHTNYHTEALRGSNWLKHQCYKTKVSQHIYSSHYFFYFIFEVNSRMALGNCCVSADSRLLIWCHASFFA